MTDSDSRPRPQYGEYASADVQRAHIREPLPQSTPLAPPLTPTAKRAVDPQSAQASATFDRVITIGMLAFGLYVVTSTVFSLFNFTALVNQSYDITGIEGSFTNVEAGKLWGAIAAVILVAGFGATIFFAVRRLRAEKRSWWVPVLGATITLVLVYACITVPLLGDPAFQDSLNSVAR